MGSADANKTLKERDEGVGGAGGLQRLQPAWSLRVALPGPTGKDKNVSDEDSKDKVEVGTETESRR